MKSSWILDLIIRDGEFYGNPDKIEGSMWFVLAADGYPQPFSTQPCSASQKLKWDFPYRLTLQINDINRAYLYVTLCTYGPKGFGVEALGRSRFGLRSLPLGSPKQFSFPIMDSKNSANEIMSVRVVATLSMIAPQFYLISNPMYHSENTLIQPSPVKNEISEFRTLPK
ncbi:hypothetical protein TVAG_237940 [Trichomonas vaginalis G3]|uniref:Uncharacterized protein n=1 Tax=Trichomonas vaginalis (strain ATCC PRA-98 / G3) TaxID=412133 RepID=A2DCZ4_TRIV3|nr:hypothetical protein TVAGG3_0606250 [Trichomonas vaginalis G3]EAY21768.1 hypothetical protein TVAG_237940 [Trichomonas vaginalis G3]KAI5524260.1 hypothetical protein TVAGG3_0606250 [Trichomonas vaginalis G3]|eukprot:XP_001582754.1 hypothetical protein [Trichomonas vaginalis G3]